jgi:hypothetical protein
MLHGRAYYASYHAIILKPSCRDSMTARLRMLELARLCMFSGREI